MELGSYKEVIHSPWFLNWNSPWNNEAFSGLLEDVACPVTSLKLDHGVHLSWTLCLEGGSGNGRFLFVMSVSGISQQGEPSQIELRDKDIATFIKIWLGKVKSCHPDSHRYSTWYRWPDNMVSPCVILVSVVVMGFFLVCQAVYKDNRLISTSLYHKHHPLPQHKRRKSHKDQTYLLLRCPFQVLDIWQWGGSQVQWKYSDLSPPFDTL